MDDCFVNDKTVETNGKLVSDNCNDVPPTNRVDVAHTLRSYAHRSVLLRMSRQFLAMHNVVSSFVSMLTELAKGSVLILNNGIINESDKLLFVLSSSL